MSADLPGALENIIDPLGAAQEFLDQLRYYFQAYVIGTTGVNKHMRDCMENARLCFDWSTLCTETPKQPHSRAFFALSDKLAPALLKGMWPVGFDWVPPRQWPRQRRDGGLFAQYQQLMRRVRKASKNNVFRDRWFVTRRFLVTPVMTTPTLRAPFGSARWSQGLSADRHACILCHIAGFAGLAGVSAASPFHVRPSSLAALGHGRSLRKSRGNRAQQRFHGQEGSFASLASKPWVGRVVYVSAVERVPTDSTIAGDLVSHARFTFSGSDGPHCWHAVRLLHRARMMQGGGRV